jgi:hypothetical protein
MKYIRKIREIDPFILSVVVFIVVVLIGGVFFVYKLSGKPVQTYTAEEAERPKFVVDKTHIDFGSIQISDTAVDKVVIENKGQKPLQIFNIKTSCGCTSTQIEINDDKSPIFSMHNNPPWTGEIQPGSRGTLKAIYEPSKHPVQGKSDKTIFFNTNDPENAEVQIYLTALVK